MGMTRIVVEGKFGGFVRECVAGIKHTSAELQLCLNALPRCVWLFYVNLVVCVALDGWADNGRGGGDDSAWGRHAGRWGVFRAWSQLRFGGVPRFLPVCVQREGRELASFFDVRLRCFGVGVVEERV